MGLKKARLGRGLSQAELAEKSGVNYRMIQKYENGEKDLNKAKAETVCKLAKALGCRMEDLVDGEFDEK